MTSFSRPSPGKVTVSHRSSWGVSGHRKSEGGHWTPISPIPARALPKQGHGPQRIPALWMWSRVGCVARSHHARSRAGGVWWAVSQQTPASASPVARRGGEGQGPLHLLAAAPPRATRACTLPPSAPPTLHHLGSLSSHLRALRMGSWRTKPSSSAELTSPKGQWDKTWSAPLSLLCSASFPSPRAWK